MTIEVPPVASRPTIKEMVATRVLDQRLTAGITVTTEAEFKAWLDRNWYGKDTDGKADVRDQIAAKTMLATWIEERVKAYDGVWFGQSDTHFTLGLFQRQPISVQAPAWMTAYIRSFPKATTKLTPEEATSLRKGDLILQEAAFRAREEYLKGRAS